MSHVRAIYKAMERAYAIPTQDFQLLTCHSAARIGRRLACSLHLVELFFLFMADASSAVADAGESVVASGCLPRLFACCYSGP